MGYRLGVDLGTTYTSAAVSRDGRTEPVSLGDHAHEIPSVVYLRPDGGYVVGDAAVAREADQPDRVAREFKRRIGDDTSIFLGGVPTSAHALTGVLLRFVVQLVTERQGGPPEQVVVTCPANWGPFRREILEHAVELGGVQDGLLCTEPEAAALQFGTSGRLADGDAVAVYDLGGGTFDAALLRREAGGALSFLGRPEGIEQLGGLDFDSALFGHVVSQLGLEGRDPDDPALTRGLLRLRHECARAKERLSYDVDTTVPVDVPGTAPSVRVTRAELEELIAPLIAETIDCLERVVQRSGVAPDELSAVLLVGGSARIPLVREMLTERLGRPLPPSPQPKLCVALGASLFGEPPSAPPPAESTSQAAGVPPPQSTSQAASTAPPEGIAKADAPPRRDLRPLLYAVASGLLAVAALGAAFLLQPEPSGTPLAWDGDRVASARLPETARSAQVRLSGQDLAGPREVEEQGFQPLRVLLAGPAEVELFGEPQAQGEPLDAEFYVAGGTLTRSLLTVPGIAAVLGLLYAFAYGETLLRGVRRRQGDVRAAEVAGMTGVGAVLGGAVAVAGWMSGRLPQTGPVVVTVVLLGAAGGLLAFAVAARAARRSEARRSASAAPQ